MSVTKTATVDTGEWNYIDKFGNLHPVTNAETFTFTLTDNGSTSVYYTLDTGNSIATDDGYTVYFATPQASGQNVNRDIGPFADTMDGVEQKNIRGEWAFKCPLSGDIQYYTMSRINIDNVDAPTVLTWVSWEDQFGNKMTAQSITIA